MDKLLLLRGKLEMAKRTIQLQKTSFAKKLAGAKSSDKGGEVLVYKDAPDADSSEEEDAGDDEEMEGEAGSDEEGMSDGSGEMSSEEEIKEIPLKKLAEKNMKKKRARRADEEDDLDGDYDSEEDSESDQDRYEKESPKKQQKKK